MKLYLSSFRLGKHSDKLIELIGKPNAKVAVSVNALDNSNDVGRKANRLEQEIADIESLGFVAQELDLRDYFNNTDVVEKMSEYDAVWFSGGNTFILAKSFKQSGFDKVIEKLVKSDKLVYAGYSAAFCVLSRSLRGVELVDDKDATADGYQIGEIWDGVGIINFYPIVHFRSNHPESDDVEKEYKFVSENNIPFKTFKDGDVFLVNGDYEKVLA